jgi:hypothetical protein
MSSADAKELFLYTEAAISCYCRAASFLEDFGEVHLSDDPWTANQQSKQRFALLAWYDQELQKLLREHDRFIGTNAWHQVRHQHLAVCAAPLVVVGVNCYTAHEAAAELARRAVDAYYSVDELGPAGLRQLAGIIADRGLTELPVGFEAVLEVERDQAFVDMPFEVATNPEHEESLTRLTGETLTEWLRGMRTRHSTFEFMGPAEIIALAKSHGFKLSRSTLKRCHKTRSSDEKRTPKITATDPRTLERLAAEKTGIDCGEQEQHARHRSRRYRPPET